METMSECPVCGGRVLASGLNSHMASHAKQDIVAALLRQRSPPESVDFSASANSGRQLQGGLLGMSSGSQSQPISLVKKSSGSGDQSLMTSQTFDLSMMPSPSTAGPFLMPQMMGMMQVISPCFIPQPNGPPILVNLPSYIYPNIGMMGGMLAAAANATGSLLPTSSASTSSPIANLGSPTAAGISFLPSSSSSNISGISSSGLMSLPPNLLPLHPVSFATSSSTATNTASTLSSLVEVVASPSSANSPSSMAMDLAMNSDDSVISVDDDKVQQEVGNLPGTSGLNSTQQQKPKLATDDSSIKMEAKTKKGNFKSKSGVYGYTRYASDSPYPAASINFSSVMNIDEPRIKHETEEEEEEEEGEAEEKPSFNPDIKDESESNQSLEEDDDDEDDENSNVCTVHTLSDLQNALKSEEDIQIVVPNELLETAEFKVFLSSLGPFPITSASAAAASSAGSSSGGDRVCLAPPNTPAVTRPPSAAPPSSPQPCSSRDLSRSGFNDPSEISDSKCESDVSEGGDDITLQDLVAMETMEDDICDDDQFYQMSSSNPLEPFMNSLMRHVGDDDNDDDSSNLASNVFSCYKCGLHFASFGEFNRHKTVCCKWRNGSSSSKGVGKKSSKKSLKKFPPPPADDPLSLDDSNANLDPLSLVKKWSQPIDLDGVTVKSEQSSVLSSADLIRQNSNSASATTVKSETFDSSSQPALAAPGANHWKCNQCRVVFESGPMLWEHLDSMHRAVNKCVICHVTFEDRKQALTHRKKFHPSMAKIKLEPPELTMPNENGEFVCDKCDRAFKDRELLTKHQSCHDEEKPYECLECGKKFSKGSLLRNHRRRHFEVGAFECQLCKKRFYTPNKLREHERVHTGEAPLSCNVCGKTFRRHSNLSEHKRIHLEVRPVKPPKELFCHCGKVFPTQRDLDWHKEGEHDNIPKKCTFCGEIFVHSSSLTRHIRLKHESDFMPTDKKSTLYAKCPICQQTFYKTSINKHIRIKHHGQKPFQCDICKISFVTKCNLDNHQWQHKGVRARPFKCQQCNKSYLRKSLLDAHMRSHRGVKPYVCNECGLQFANKSNWQRHVAEHSGSRNYPCHLCDKRFSRNYYLSDHLKTHTGEKPFVCGICGKSAATRSNYNSHLRTHITREPVNSEV